MGKPGIRLANLDRRAPWALLDQAHFYCHRGESERERTTRSISGSNGHFTLGMISHGSAIL